MIYDIILLFCAVLFVVVSCVISYLVSGSLFGGCGQGMRRGWGLRGGKPRHSQPPISRCPAILFREWQRVFSTFIFRFAAFGLFVGLSVCLVVLVFLTLDIISLVTLKFLMSHRICPLSGEGYSAFSSLYSCFKCFCSCVMFLLVSWLGVWLFEFFVSCYFFVMFTASGRAVSR